MVRYKYVDGKRLKMSPAEIKAHDEMQARETAKIESEQYRVNRKSEYPCIRDQLDLLWKDMENGTIPGKGAEWHSTIKKIKDKYPKP